MATQLSNNKIKALKPKKSAYKVADLFGLYVYVSTSGSKLFRFDYTDGGKRKTKSIGSADLYTVERARELTLEIKRRLKEGLPAEEKESRSFGDLSSELCKLRGFGEMHKQSRRLTLYALPVLGNLPVDKITAPDILKCVKPIEAKGHGETARRTLNIIGQVLRYAVALGEVDRDITQSMRGALLPVDGDNFKAITEEPELALFLRAVNEYGGGIVVKTYLQIAPHLAMRPSELRFLKWDNVDFEAKRINYRVTKVNKDHIVFLSDYVLDKLATLRNYSKGVLVFDSGENRPISDASALRAIRRLGFDTTVHGFRATFRTLAAEKLKANSEVLELSLSHVIDRYNGAYSRVSFIDERVKLYNDWSAYLLNLT